MKLKKQLPLLALFLLISLNLSYTFREILFEPGTHYLKTSGDGFKNYFTPWYHIKYDESYHHFEGMNYPFGEHIVYTDAQPAISNLLKFFSNNIYDISDRTPSIIHLLLILSFFFSGFLIFRILAGLQVDHWFAAIMAALIVSMTPQLFRFPGHYALAYTVVIPGLIYFVQNFYKSPHFKWSIALSIWITFWAGVHPYYLMMSFLYLGACWVLTIFYKRFRNDWKKLIPHFLLQVILPVIFFKFYLILTDQVNDRPGNPFGFFVYRASWISVFLPMYLPHIMPLKKLISFSIVEWEGIAYVGIPGTIAGLYFLFRNSRFALKKKWSRFLRPSLHAHISIPVMASAAVLMFSMRYPFVKFLHDVVDYIPYLNQFRSIGRFAWIFYYGWLIFVAYWLWLAYRAWGIRGKKYIGASLLVLSVLTLGSESFLWNRFIRQGNSGISRLEVMEDKQNLMPENEWINHIDSGKYSAIMVIPYFHVGSENFYLLNEGSVIPAFSAALKTGLPLLNVMMSRSSFSQTWQHMEMVTEENGPLSIVENLPSEKPILVLSINYVLHDRPYRMPSLGKLVYTNDKVALYEVSREDLKNMGRNRPEKMLEQFASQDTLYRHNNGWLTDQKNAFIFYNSMDDEKQKLGYQNSGGMEEISWDYNYLYQGNLPKDNYDILTWVFLKKDLRPLVEIGLEQLDSDSTAIFFEYLTCGMTVRMLDGDWGLVQRYLPMKENADHVNVIIRRSAKNPKLVRYDEFMIKPAGVNIYGYKNGNLIINNRYFEIKKASYEEALQNIVIVD